MSPTELQIVGALITLIVVCAVCVSCYRAGWRAADQDWLATATDANKYKRFTGRYYFAAEIQEEPPEIDTSHVDFDDYPLRQQPQHRADYQE